MSECVVRMEMPKHCGECELQIWDIWPGSFKCAKTRTDIMSHMRNRTKPNDCPIICQLPEGHGRLVDADANIETLCYRFAQRVLEEAPTVEPASPWRRVEERLPDDSREVIIFTASKIIGVGSFIRPNWYQWYSGGGLPVDVTYWMPLPEPPKENADADKRYNTGMV